MQGVRRMWAPGGGDYGTPIPAKVRRAVLRQHKGICHVCRKAGATEVDHVLSRKAGGTDHPDNLRPIHPRPCHVEKTQREAQAARAARRHRQAPSHPGMQR